MNVDIITSLPMLEELAAPWDNLALNSGRCLPTSSAAWLLPFLRHRLARDHKWLCLSGFDDSGLAGVWLLIGGDQDRFRNPNNPHAPSVEPVFRPGVERETLAAFTGELKRALPNWSEIALIGVDSDCALAGTDARSLPGIIRVTSPAGRASVVDTSGEFDELASRLSRNFRRRLKKSRKKYEGLADAECTFHTGSESLEDHLRNFLRVEAAGWKGRAESAIQSSENLRDLYREMAGRFADRQALEWHFLHAEGRVIASHMAIKAGAALYIWKIGYDEEYAHCSPGVLLMEETLKRAFETEGINEVNLVSDRSWHDNWVPVKRTYRDVWLYPCRIRPLVTRAWPKQLRIALRSIPGLKAAVDKIRGGGEGRRNG